MKVPLKKRILLVMGAFAIQAVYTPTSLLMRGGIEPRLPIDIFPLCVGWVIPYVLCYPLWAAAIGWLIWKMDDRRFRAAIAAMFFTFTLGVCIFLLFPTYVVQPELTGNDLLTNILRTIQAAGGDHDALPSAHIYMTVVLALIYDRWYPRLRWTWILIVALISLSTLFTHQHHVADVLAGYLTGWLGYRFGLWWNTIGGKFNHRKISHA